jgi:glutamine synthetase
MSIFIDQPAAKLPESPLTTDSVAKELEADTKVKLAGVDIDGVLRGKLISKKKFLSVAKDGFGFCSVIFGWDMHDTTYFRELTISNKENGYRDIVAKIDLTSFRRIPWEDNVPFFLVSFYDPDTDERLSACPRGLLARMADKVEKKGYRAMAGGRLKSSLLSRRPS